MAYIQNNLGMALELTGNADESEVAYRRAAEADPAHEKARINLARLESIAPQPEAGASAGPVPIQAVAEAISVSVEADKSEGSVE